MSYDKKYWKKYYRKIKQNKDKYKKYRARMNKWRKEYRQKNPEIRKKEILSVCKYRKKKWKELKEKIFIVLGNKCARCGFSDKRILQIDHISGGGYAELKRFRGNWLRHLKYILRYHKKYQLLCPNCNWFKRIERNENGK